ncbi:MAG: efflux RND transporter periplasmic adaptor subunit [Burkholderiaceae bacterium]|jgi:Cu(I)/Ag(I) efflux system membrane fusion protein|nr:efflux RND transporter periplasmic adaptor subunit [Burkholderiaceae bacterium]
MNAASIGKGIALLAALAVAAAAGYWFGGRHPSLAPDSAAGAAAPPEKGGRRILYYRNPMGLPDTSPTPKKDSMGMDYIPVYEGEQEDAGGGVKISDAKIQRLGVRSVPVERRALDAVVRASGRIEADERRLATVTPKFEGYVEKLFVNATGQYVARGVPLFEAYSPELLATQREYAIAAQGLAQLKGADEATVAGMKRLADSALERLRNWDVTDEQIAQLAAGGQPQRALTFRAPASGYVIERKATQGMRFMPGEALYQLADLSTVWVIAEVAEQDIGRVRTGLTARARLDAYPGQNFEGRITYIYPTLKADTRTAQVRVELPNPQGRLKPAMYAQVEIAAAGRPQLVVPSSAVIDNGRRRVVLVDRGEGRFEPRDVKLGERGDEFTAVLEGVKDGERVVVAANFLLDSEANLKAALGALTGGADTAKVTHRAVGTLDDVDAKTGTLLITHEPVESLKWPRMTMEFVPANEAIAGKLKPGAAIEFDFVERKPGEWVVTKMEARK